MKCANYYSAGAHCPKELNGEKKNTSGFNKDFKVVYLNQQSENDSNRPETAAFQSPVV